MGIVIGFPRKQAGDFTLTKYLESLEDPTMYGDRGATWDINPQYDPEHPLFKNFDWVTIPDLNVRVPAPFEKDFTRDPTNSTTKYLCNPPPQEGGFFEIPLKVAEAVDPTLPPVVLVTDVVEKPVPVFDIKVQDYVDQVMRFVAIEIDQLPPRRPECAYFMHGDPGLTSDAFALCVGHTEGEVRQIVEPDGTTREVRRVVIDFVLTWEPRPNVPVDLMNVDRTIELLARYYGIRHVTFDRWNSANSIQQLIDKGIMAEDLSFSAAQQLQMYRNLKLLLYNGLLSLPADEDLTNELVYLKVKNGKIDHDVYGKDRADAVAAVAGWATGSGKDSPPDRRCQGRKRSPGWRYRNHAGNA